jgi:DNA-binding GntR family transcriptional regulator
MPDPQSETDRITPTQLDAPRRVAIELQRRIVIGDLRPGDQIRQNEWAKRLGVSGVPVREALKILESHDLLVHDPRRGYFVSRLDPKQVDQLYEMRILIETKLLRTIRWPTAEELAFIEKVTMQWMDELIEGDLEAANETYGLSLSSVWELSPLDLFIREANRFWWRTNPYRTVVFASIRAADPGINRFREDSRELLDGLKAHDRNALVRTTTRNLRRSKDHWIGIFGLTNNSSRLARSSE